MMGACASTIAIPASNLMDYFMSLIPRGPFLLTDHPGDIPLAQGRNMPSPHAICRLSLECWEHGALGSTQP